MWLSDIAMVRLCDEDGDDVFLPSHALSLVTITTSIASGNTTFHLLIVCLQVAVGY